MASFFDTLLVVATAAAATYVKTENDKTYRTAVDSLEERICNIKSAVRAAGKINTSSYNLFVADDLTQAKDCILKFEMDGNKKYLSSALEHISTAEENCNFFLKVSI